MEKEWEGEIEREKPRLSYGPLANETEAPPFLWPAWKRNESSSLYLILWYLLVELQITSSKLVLTCGSSCVFLYVLWTLLYAPMNCHPLLDLFPISQWATEISQWNISHFTMKYLTDSHSYYFVHIRLRYRVIYIDIWWYHVISAMKLQNQEFMKLQK